MTHAQNIFFALRTVMSRIDDGTLMRTVSIEAEKPETIRPSPVPKGRQGGTKIRTKAVVGEAAARPAAFRFVNQSLTRCCVRACQTGLGRLWSRS
jgi:hypothetical protein